MAINLVSDLHLEFSNGQFNLPELPNEHQDVLVLAGDVGIASKPHTFRPFLETISDRFRDIIYICGNHEFYHGSFTRGLDKIREQLNLLVNVHVVNNEVIRVDNMSFVCSTMWSSFDRGNPNAMMAARYRMNDYKLIRTGPPGDAYKRKLTPEDTYQAYLDAINFIFPAIEREKEAGQRVCVVTHHLPSFRSVAPEYVSDELNGAYGSNLDEEILEAQPDLMVHGHTHRSTDYMIGKTRIVCNPRGYYQHDENPGFDPELRIVLE